MGKKFSVEINESGKHYLKGVPIQESSITRPEGVPKPYKQGEITGLPLHGHTSLTATDEKQISSHHPLFVCSIFILIICVLLRLYYIVSGYT